MNSPERRSSTERLVARLRHRGLAIGDDWEFHRTYAGPAQRCAEAWSWWIDWTDPNGRRWEVGSCTPVRDLLRSGALSIEDQSWRSPGSYVVEAVTPTVGGV